MSEELWTAVDTYLNDHLIPSDPALTNTLKANTAGDLPAIDVSPTQGKFLTLLARMQGAKRILEIGTLGGYSTICLARALPPEGKLVTLELNPHHAAVAKENIRNAGLSHLVEQRVGPALESLAQLEAENTLPFDLIFMDADKPNNPNYLDWAIRLSHPGTVIIGDNVIREGIILEDHSTDPIVTGTRIFLEKLGAHPRLEATVIQTVGSKGHDGFSLAIVKP
jgi:predicted O-methyltransferase YrrM